MIVRDESPWWTDLAACAVLAVLLAVLVLAANSCEHHRDRSDLRVRNADGDGLCYDVKRGAYSLAYVQRGCRDGES